MGTGYRSLLLGERKGNQKMQNREEPCPLLCHPVGRSGIVALGTMSVLAGMIAVPHSPHAVHW